MRKPIKKQARPVKQAKPVSPGGPPVSLSAEDKRQIKASRAIDKVVSLMDAYTHAVEGEVRYATKRGFTTEKHEARVQAARAKMLDAVGKLRLIVCPQAAALTS